MFIRLLPFSHFTKSRTYMEPSATLTDPAETSTTVWDVMEKFVGPIPINAQHVDERPTGPLAVQYHPEMDLMEAIATNHIDLAIHCCNCYHVMGAGIALALRRKYPGVHAADKQTPHGDVRKLGCYTACQVTPQTTVINLYAMHNYGRGKRFVCYKAMRLGLDRLFRHLMVQLGDERFHRLHIGTCWMGCHNAGGEKAVVKDILVEVCQEFGCCVTVFGD